MIRITHVINNLQVGGAELSLKRLLKGVDRGRFESTVISLIGDGTVAPQLRKQGFDVVALGAARGRISPRTLLDLRKQLRHFGPDIIQSWMYHSNLAADLARGALAVRPPLSWNIRHSLHDLRHEKWLTRQVIKSGARRSSRIEATVFNSSVSLGQHEGIGYRSPMNVVIPNGVDLDVFRPIPGAREELRRLLGVSDDAVLIGGVGRFHPMKDHGLLARAVRLAAEGGDVHCVIAGRGYEVEQDTAELRARSGLGDRLHLLPERESIECHYSGLDLFVVSSRWGEGFPNVLAEAMACEVPCASTDVGDAARILGDPARICPPGDLNGMVAILRDFLNATTSDKLRMGRFGRERIEARFLQNVVVDRYQELWTDLVSNTGGVP
ncbi:MAG: glycosyltransferase [Phycisphaerales bacterium]|nr:glycosyltransferase [Phycisphaerales bacterium]